VDVAAVLGGCHAGLKRLDLRDVGVSELLCGFELQGVGVDDGLANSLAGSFTGRCCGGGDDGLVQGGLRSNKLAAGGAGG